MDAISVFKEKGKGWGVKHLSTPHRHNVPFSNYLDFTNFCI